MLHTNSPWVCLIKVCSNGGATYIIGEIIDENNLNIVNIIQNLGKSSSSKLLNRILRYCTQIDLVLFRIKRDIRCSVSTVICDHLKVTTFNQYRATAA